MVKVRQAPAWVVNSMRFEIYRAIWFKRIGSTFSSVSIERMLWRHGFPRVPDLGYSPAQLILHELVDEGVLERHQDGDQITYTKIDQSPRYP